VVHQPVEHAEFLPAVAEWQLISSDTTPPSESDCFAGGIRCFTPTAMRAAYNYPPLFTAGYDGKGITIAIIDSFGSPTIASDLHVFDTAFGLQPMCGRRE
jgi:subtilase family serine protease